MTCIVGVVQEGRTWIGADSAGSNGRTTVVRADKKLFRNGPYLIGFTTSFRMGQILQYDFQPPSPRGKDLFAFMVKEFVPTVRSAMKNGGCLRTTTEGVDGSGIFMVGIGARLFKVESDFQVAESSFAYNACGSAENIALGSLHSSKGSPRSRIKMALEAASRHSPDVSPPFVIKSVGA